MKMLRALAIAVTLLCSMAASSHADGVAGLAARAGDTIGLPLGRQVQLSRQQVRVHFLPVAGPALTYEPGHPGVRAVANVYPDPMSKLALEATRHRGGHDIDWWDTTVYVDLPATMKPGLLRVSVEGPSGPISNEAHVVEIVPGVGSPHSEQVLAALERAAHVVVTFGGREVPHAIQVDLAHRAGPGVARVVNPRSDVKSLVWADTGARLRIIMTPANGQTLPGLVDFTFYLTGELPGLDVTSVSAYDVDGRRLLDITATIQ